jgi:hypothetical protein
MSLGKLTFLSADCDGSGAVVGSSGMVADSSGVDGGGCRGGAEGAVLGPVAAGAAWLACSAARSVTNAAPDKTTPLRAISQIDRLFGITHHSKTYGCTGAVRAVRAVAPGQSQIHCSGGPPIGTPYDMTSTAFGAQWVGDWPRVHK